LTTSGPAAASCEWDQNTLTALAGGFGLAAALAASWNFAKGYQRAQELKDFSIVKEIQVSMPEEILVAYDPELELKLRDEAILRIERWWRRILADRLLIEMGLREGHQLAASTFLQSSFRSTADRRKGLELKKRKNKAAAKIQKRFRRFLAKRIAKQMGMGTMGTLFLEMHLTNAAAEETREKERERAAQRIQNAWWMYIARKLTAEALLLGVTAEDDPELAKMVEGAAVVMQTLFRGQAARRNAERLRLLRVEKERQSAMKIQGMCKIWDARRTVAGVRRVKHNAAATVIQSWYRMLEYRKWFLMKKKVWHLDMVREDLLEQEPAFLQHHREDRQDGGCGRARR
jgi:hypothetical protein